MILVTNPTFQTALFATVLFGCLLISARKKKYTALFPKELTTELKGLAILLIIFSHIGYILASTDKFLWPLSTMAGVGVNLFLFLSGFGLTVSALKKKPNLKITAARLLKLFVPLWIVLGIFFTLDYFVLHIVYSNTYITQSFAGLFLRADAGLDVNSVLWYFTIVLFYYLLFPIVFMRRYVWVSALILVVLSVIIIRQDPVRLHDVMRLYQVHNLAFPLGMIIAWLATNRFAIRARHIKSAYQKKIHSMRKGKLVDKWLYAISLVMLACIIGYSAIHSGVEQQPLMEQLISLFTMSAVILFFIVKRFTVGILAILGIVSFEIYLLHWPLISRYDFLYVHMPPWLATILYLIVFVVLGYALKRMSELLIARAGVK